MAFDHINVGCPAAATDFYWILLVIFCLVAVLFTLFEESSITPLPGGSVIYPVEGEVKCSFAGWQSSLWRVAICPRLRPDIPFVSAAWSIFWIFSFSFSLLFARKCIFQAIFSRTPNFIFSQQLYCHCSFCYPLQDSQKATTWGEMCGSRKERIFSRTTFFFALFCNFIFSFIVVYFFDV